MSFYQIPTMASGAVRCSMGGGALPTRSPPLALPLRPRLAHRAAARAVGLGPRVPVACASSSGEPREIGCPDLYNMVQAVSEQSQAQQQPRGEEPKQAGPAPQASPAAAAPQQPAQQQQQAPAPPQQQDAGRYYAGLVTSGLAQDNGASAADMLKRSLQLAGGIAGVLVLLTLGFLASNGLL